MATYWTGGDANHNWFSWEALKPARGGVRYGAGTFWARDVLREVGSLSNNLHFSPEGWSQCTAADLPMNILGLNFSSYNRSSDGAATTARATDPATIYRSTYDGFFNVAELVATGITDAGSCHIGTEYEGSLIHVGRVFADGRNIVSSSSAAFTGLGFAPQILTGAIPRVPVKSGTLITALYATSATCTFSDKIILEASAGKYVQLAYGAFIHEPAGPVTVVVRGPKASYVRIVTVPHVTTARAGGFLVEAEATLRVWPGSQPAIGLQGITLPSTRSNLLVEALTNPPKGFPTDFVFTSPITLDYSADTSPLTAPSPITFAPGARYGGAITAQGSATSVDTVLSLGAGVLRPSATVSFGANNLTVIGPMAAVPATSAAPPDGALVCDATGAPSISAARLTLQNLSIGVTAGSALPTFTASNELRIVGTVLLGHYVVDKSLAVPPATALSGSLQGSPTVRLAPNGTLKDPTYTEEYLKDVKVPADVVGTAVTPSRLIVRTRSAPTQPFPQTLPSVGAAVSSGGVVYDGANSGTAAGTFNLTIDKLNAHVGYNLIKGYRVTVAPGAHPGGSRTYLRDFGQLHLQAGTVVNTTLDVRSHPGWVDATTAASVGQVRLEDGSELAGKLVLRPTEALTTTTPKVPTDLKCYVRLDPGATATISATIESLADATAATAMADLALTGSGSTCVLSGAGNKFGRLVLSGVTVTSGASGAYGKLDTDLQGDAVVGSSAASTPGTVHVIDTGFAVKVARATTLSFKQLGSDVIYSKALSDGAGAAKLNVLCLPGATNAKTILTAENTYTGTTTVQANSRLEIGSGVATGVATGSLKSQVITVAAGGEVSFFRKDGVAPVDTTAVVTGGGNVRWRAANSLSLLADGIGVGTGGYSLAGLANSYAGITYVDDARVAGPTTGATGNAFGTSAVQVQGFGQVWVYRLTGTYRGLERASLPNDVTLFNGLGWQEGAGSPATYGSLRLENATLSGVLTLNGVGQRLVTTGRGSELSGKLTGTATLAVAAYDGALTLSSVASDFTGGIEVRSGAVRLTGALGASATGFSYGGDINVDTGTAFVAANSKTQEFSGRITGTGTWRKEGSASTVILSGASNDAFKFEIADGSGKVRVAPAGRLGSGDKSVGASSTLTLTSVNALNNAGNLTVAGTLEVPAGVAGSGATPAVPSMTYPAGLTLKAGSVLRIGSAV